MDDEILQLLRCLETKQPLANIDDALLLQLNEAVQAQRLVNRLGRPIERPLSGGLINRDGTLVYPIFDGIPVLIRDEAIELAANSLT